MSGNDRTVPGSLLADEIGYELIETLADAAAEISFLLDSSGRLRWTSAAVCERVGIPRRDLVGLPMQDVVAMFGEVGNPEVLARIALGRGTDGEVIVISRERQQAQHWYQPILRRIEAADDRGPWRFLILYDVSELMEQVWRAERAKRAVEQRLHFDTETGLPNARRTIEYLTAELAEDGECPVHVVLVDIMSFEQILDLYGATVASLAVRELAALIAAFLPAGQFFARTKEHEFAVVFSDVASKKAIIAIAERMSSELALEVPTALGDCRVQTLLSIAEMRRGSGTGEQLLTNARIALGFRDLARRAGQIRIYEAEMRAALEARSRTYGELYAAIDNDEIEPFFQPQVRLTDRDVIGFEVLVRWRHPEQGIVPPGLFLEIAEETGLLPQIDDIVMRKALACLASWRRMGFEDPHVSLNCTGEALRDPSYVEKLKFELDRHGLAPRDVAIEILESVLIRDEADIARKTLTDLEKAGFILEIDDFGTGQASISHLINLNAKVVKLDRSLVRDIVSNRAKRLVVEATVALSTKLGLEVLAEGAEDADQIDVLKELGCQYVQGFGIARPMSYDDTTRWLETHVERSGGEARTA